MDKGDVLFWKGFTFADGGSANKLFLVAGVRERDGSMFMFKTTTTERTYHPEAHGCHSDHSVYRINDEKNFGFDGPNWIIYDPPEYATRDDAKRAGAGVIFTMKPHHVGAILNCYRRCPEFFEASKVWIG